MTSEKQQARRVIVRIKENASIENVLPAGPSGFGENHYKVSRLFGEATREPTILEVPQATAERKAGFLSVNEDDEYRIMSEEQKKLRRIFTIEIPEEGEVDSFLENLNASDDVEYAQEDMINDLLIIPNDAHWNDLWGMEKVDGHNAWDSTQGDDVVVAVVDTGVDYKHPDIKKNMWSSPSGKFGYDFSDDDDDPMDYHGHGSHVAGTIAAVGHNNIGVIGLAPKAKIMAIKIFPYAYDSKIVKALRWAVDNGAKVLNNSWGPRTPRPSNPAVEDAIDYVNSKGGICVFAAGNSNDDTQRYAPANKSTVITVGATDKGDKRASFSNWGMPVNVSAPGVDILSLKHKTSSFKSDSGTSMACPHVAGLAALYLKQHPGATRQDIQKALEDGVDSINTDKPLGKGRINAAKTVSGK
uniref:Thermitase n=1 Tax=Candidatus Kentrum sp. LPFa TaxID=2126335 RepID=A0A450X2B9_9GAMM|nr:MAG: thermitase [Candidatus Kentron sp. LPFa]